MNPDSVLSIFHQALEVIVVLILVMLIPSLLIGLLVAMFQAATQINEMTLSFVPKILVTLLVLMLAGPWMLQLLVHYTEQLIHNIPSFIG